MRYRRTLNRIPYHLTVPIIRINKNFRFRSPLTKVPGTIINSKSTGKQGAPVFSRGFVQPEQSGGKGSMPVRGPLLECHHKGLRITHCTVISSVNQSVSQSVN